MSNYEYANGAGLSVLSQKIFEHLSADLNLKADKATTYTKTDVDNLVDTDVVTSEADNPLILETDAAQYAKATHLTLAPVQDLHGYDHPWPAGGEKNLLPYPYSSSSETLNGVTITVNDNGSITLNGTSTANVEFYISRRIAGPFTPDAGTYILTGCPTGYSNYRMRIGYNRGSSGATIAYDTGSGATITENEGGVYYGMWLAFDSGATFNNLTIYPMVRKSTETDATWAPYSNICPISGLDEVKVERTGKNLLNWNDFVQGSMNSVGIDTVAYTRLRSQFVKVKPLTNYTFSTNSNVLVYEIHFYDNNKNFISFRSVNLTSTTVQTVQDAEYVKILLRKSDNLVINVDEGEGFQMELGSTATDYEPYISSELSVDLPTTIYGGTLNLETGELVVDWKKIKLRDLSISDRTATYFYSSTTTDKAYGATKVKCSCYKTVDVSAGDMPECSIKGNGGNSYLYITDTRFSTGTELKNALGDQDIVYELAAPITYHLTPAQLDLLKGTNVITVNGKTIQVTYREGALATLEELNVISFDLSNVKSKLPPIIIKNGMLQVTYDDEQ